jgi:alcohol dehydrogenase
MKAIKVHKFGGPEVLEYEDAVKPAPRQREVLIEVHGASINPVDAKAIKPDSSYKDHLKLPVTPGTDVAGVVVGVGEDVISVEPGDKVYGQAGVLQNGSGSFAEFAVAPESTIAKMPKNLSFVEAATIPLAAASAYHALTELIKLQEGQKILIHGGAGGIGSFAIQLAKHLGAYVATTTAVSGVNFARHQGADEVIDYEFQSFEKTLKDYDAVLDTVGGEVYKKSFEVLKNGGIVVSMLCEPDKDLMKKYDVRAALEITKVDQGMLNRISQLIELGALRVNISKTYPLKNTKDAYAAKDSEHILGKIAIEVGEDG